MRGKEKTVPAAVVKVSRKGTGSKRASLERLKISLSSFRVITKRIGAFGSSTTTTRPCSSAFVSTPENGGKWKAWGKHIQLQACKSVIEPVETLKKRRKSTGEAKKIWRQEKE